MMDDDLKLLTEYRRIIKPLKNDTADLNDVKAALWHVLKRLGPPTVEDEADAGIADDLRDALKRQTSGAA